MPSLGGTSVAFGVSGAAGTRRTSKDKTMNARKLASKVLASLAVLAALSTLSGCMVWTRPAPARYHHWYR
jgi:hypothetical protein